MTAILLAAGVATAATVVFTGVMSVKSNAVEVVERRRKLRREPAKNEASKTKDDVLSFFITQFSQQLNSQTYTGIKHMRRQKRQLLKRKRRNEARNEVRNAPRKSRGNEKISPEEAARRRREQRRNVCRNLRNSKRSKLLLLQRVQRPPQSSRTTDGRRYRLRNRNVKPSLTTRMDLLPLLLSSKLLQQ